MPSQSTAGRWRSLSCFFRLLLLLATSLSILFIVIRIPLLLPLFLKSLNDGLIALFLRLIPIDVIFASDGFDLLSQRVPFVDQFLPSSYIKTTSLVELRLIPADGQI